MSDLLSKLGIDWRIVLIQVINFAVLAFVLTKFLYKPVLKVLKERGEKEKRAKEDAQAIAEKLCNLDSLKEELTANMRREEAQILKHAKETAEKNRTATLATTKADVELAIMSGTKTLEAKKIQMVEEAKKEIVSLVVEATNKLLGTRTSKSTDEKSAKDLFSLS